MYSWHELETLVCGVEDVDIEYEADMDEFGAGSGDPRAGGAEWEDDEEEEGGPQCATQ